MFSFMQRKTAEADWAIWCWPGGYGDNNLFDFKFLGQFREGMLAFDGFKGNLGLESRRELTT
jgi:hypothetical protein